MVEHHSIRIGHLRPSIVHPTPLTGVPAVSVIGCRRTSRPPAFEEPVQVLPPARQAGTISYARNPERHWLHAGARSRRLYARAQRPDQCMMAPALTLMSCPVMLSAACEHKKSTVSTTSASLTVRLKAVPSVHLGPQLVSE